MGKTYPVLIPALAAVLLCSACVSGGRYGWGDRNTEFSRIPVGLHPSDFDLRKKGNWGDAWNTLSHKRKEVSSVPKVTFLGSSTDVLMVYSPILETVRTVVVLRQGEGIVGTSTVDVGTVFGDGGGAAVLHPDTVNRNSTEPLSLVILFINETAQTRDELVQSFLVAKFPRENSFCVDAGDLLDSILTGDHSKGALVLR